MKSNNRYDLNDQPWKSFGHNSGCPITVDMGGWRITYTQDGEIKVGLFNEATNWMRGPRSSLVVAFSCRTRQFSYVIYRAI